MRLGHAAPREQSVAGVSHLATRRRVRQFVRSSTSSQTSRRVMAGLRARSAVREGPLGFASVPSASRRPPGVQGRATFWPRHAPQRLSTPRRAGTSPAGIPNGPPLRAALCQRSPMAAAVPHPAGVLCACRRPIRGIGWRRRACSGTSSGRGGPAQAGPGPGLRARMHYVLGRTTASAVALGRRPCKPVAHLPRDVRSALRSGAHAAADAAAPSRLQLLRGVQVWGVGARLAGGLPVGECAYALRQAHRENTCGCT